jgi:beta-xylosidase
MKSHVKKLNRSNYSLLFLTCCLSFFSLHLFAQTSYSTQPAGFGTHDPVMIKYQDTNYLFATGRGISVASSTDLTNWKRESPVFSAPLPWVNDTIVPGNKSLDIWAPDISFHR